jgi:outer membrane protein OmpA-like peptidoglycan-associated protein
MNSLRRQSLAALARRFLLILALAPLLAFAADVGQDHPLVGRIPGFVINQYDVHDYDAFDTKLGRTGQPDLPFHAEGKVTYIHYYRSDKEISPFEIVANYATALQQAGAVALNQSDSALGYRAFKLSRPGTGDIFVVVDPGGSHTHNYSLTFIEAADRQQVVTADALYKTLGKVGFVAFYVNFDTDKSTLKPDAAPQVAQVVALLKANPTLNVFVDGHTDNVGTAAANKSLSQARAQSVAQELVKQGIAASRLSARGFGPDVPIADNRLEEGRALNRRVELVKRP